jgi:hypothetical protein
MTNDQIVALLASIGACLSAVATFLTVRQIAKQRVASYRPELALSQSIFEGSTDPAAGLLHIRARCVIDQVRHARGTYIVLEEPREILD